MSSHAGICLHCRKRCANQAGLTQHVNRCKIRRQHLQRHPAAAAITLIDARSLQNPRHTTVRVSRPETEADNSRSSTPTTSHTSDRSREATHVPCSAQDVDARPQQRAVTQVPLDSVGSDQGPGGDRVQTWMQDTGFEDSGNIVDHDPLDLTRDIFEEPDDDAISPAESHPPDHHRTSMRTASPDGDDISTTASGGSIRLSAGRLSVTAVARATVQTFEAVTGIKAGTGSGQSNDDVAALESDLHGFSNEIDLGLAHWLHNERISSNAIGRLLQDPRLESLAGQLSWRNSEDLRSRIGNMQAESNIGDWQKETFDIPCSHTLSGVATYTMRYRKVINAVKFFLGHPGFKHDLVYAPYRSWTDTEKPSRVYGEMASADWWWNTQLELNRDGATIVPLIISSDKTQVTNHAGDLAAHAVYLTIGNLKMHARHSNQRPGSILIALLPIVKHGTADERSTIFHECFKRLFKDTARMTDAEGVVIKCADGMTRHCFPIVSAITADYEEQVKFTGVKSGRHCTMCKIAPHKREDLQAVADWRTQRETKLQIKEQRRKDYSGNKDDMVHDVPCFTWGHRYVNIHKTMMVDLLHQLHKGLLMHLMQWIKDLLIDKLPLVNGPRMRLAVQAARARGVKGNIRPSKELVVGMIDCRFASITKFPNMRIFKHFSKISQWTGKEQKSMVRQLLPVFVPLLQEAKQPEAIRFTRAVVDFVLLASYPSHDSDTLRYLEAALYRMNQHKEVFREYRPADGTEEGHFNFPKWHVLSHYVHMIKEYGSARNFDTNHAEHQHIIWVKDGFKLTNKKNGWEDQVMEYNRRKLNVLAMFDTGRHFRPLNLAKRIGDNEEPAIRPTEPVNVAAFFGWGKVSRGRIRRRKRDTTVRVEDVIAQLSEEDGLILQHALAVFMREARASRTSIQTGIEPERLEDDPSWIIQFNIQFHSALRCWKQSGKDPDDVEAIEADIVRACPDWQGIKGNARYDWIWVQEYQQQGPGTENPDIAFGGRLPAQLQYILTVMDPSSGDKYCGVLVNIARPKTRDGAADAVHGMTVIKCVPPDLLRRPRALNGRRIYPLTSVYHSIHVTPVLKTDHRADAELYINNAADWNTYNTLYNDDWEQEAIRAAALVERQRHSHGN